MESHEIWKSWLKVYDPRITSIQLFLDDIAYDHVKHTILLNIYDILFESIQSSVIFIFKQKTPNIKILGQSGRSREVKLDGPEIQK